MDEQQKSQNRNSHQQTTPKTRTLAPSFAEENQNRTWRAGERTKEIRIKVKYEICKLQQRTQNATR